MSDIQIHNNTQFHNKKPIVSIIIPVYNGSNFLKESIDSALAQTYKPLEVIVVNDGSNDNGDTERIALSYGNEIKYFFKENGGVSSALNYGIKKMEGQFFSWLSHDDLYHVDKIKEELDAYYASNSKKSIVFCNDILIDDKRNIIKKRNYLKQEIINGNQMFKILLNGRSLNGCSLLIPRTVLVELGYFDESLRYIQDWKMWVLISLQRYDFIHVDKYLVMMRLHGNQQTVKLKNILPIESNKFSKELLHVLSLNIIENKKKIMTLLFLSIRRNDKEVIDLIITILKNNGQFNLFNKFQYLFYYPIGLIKRIIKKIYKLFTTKRRI